MEQCMAGLLHHCHLVQHINGVLVSRANEATTVTLGDSILSICHG